MIAHNRPTITPEDRGCIDAVLASGWIAEGPAVASLEQTFVELQGAGAACAVSSGTAALFLALKALGAGVGEAVAVPTYSCSALLNAVIMAGAVPRPVDVDPASFCLSSEALRRQAPDAEFVIAVHVFGAPMPVADIAEPNRVVIEDCCQALGGVSGGRRTGWDGAAAIFSFYATKVITGGQGGLVWSADQRVIDSIRDYREFDGREAYTPRFNFQMTDIQAALVNSQLSRLERIRARRAGLARLFNQALGQGLRTQAGVLDEGRIVHRFVVVAPDESVRDSLRTHLLEAGVDARVPIERFELLHRYLGCDASAYPVAERLAGVTLSLPIHAGVTDDDAGRIADALHAFRP